MRERAKEDCCRGRRDSFESEVVMCEVRQRVRQLLREVSGTACGPHDRRRRWQTSGFGSFNSDDAGETSSQIHFDIHSFTVSKYLVGRLLAYSYVRWSSESLSALNYRPRLQNLHLNRIDDLESRRTDMEHTGGSGVKHSIQVHHGYDALQGTLCRRCAASRGRASKARKRKRKRT